jgi:hypothetical protein
MSFRHRWYKILLQYTKTDVLSNKKPHIYEFISVVYVRFPPVGDYELVLWITYRWPCIFTQSTQYCRIWIVALSWKIYHDQCRLFSRPVRGQFHYYSRKFGGFRLSLYSVQCTCTCCYSITVPSQAGFPVLIQLLRLKVKQVLLELSLSLTKYYKKIFGHCRYPS